jgi:hypothetical protein
MLTGRVNHRKLAEAPLKTPKAWAGRGLYPASGKSKVVWSQHG